MNPNTTWSISRLINLTFGLFLGYYSASLSAKPCASTTFMIGAAKAEITGPLDPVGMMGYGEFSQKVAGIHMPLMSRALFVQDQCGGLPVVIVINDMGMIFGSIREQIIKSINKLLPGVFTESRVLLSATHTHAGVGGFADRLLYNITTGGRHQATMDAIVRGTVEAIVQAYQSQEPGTLQLSQGDSPDNLQFNRSLEAYEKNPPWEKSMYQNPFDPNMVMLVAKDLNNEEIAGFNWFGVHPVSLSIENNLVSGDNKGVAAFLLEEHLNKKPRQRQAPFIGGFVQSKAGDISPYPVGDFFWNPHPDDRGWTRNIDHGRSQFKLAATLIDQTGTPLSGPVQNFEATHSLAHEIYSLDGHIFKTCGGVLGVSFAAGTENARPFPIFKEGTIFGVNWPKWTLMPTEQTCHQQKVLLLPTGFLKPKSWTANRAPFQLVRLGNLLIAGLPFEVTTMAGRRIERMLMQTTSPFGIKQVVLTSLANEYLHYVTTREEYESQQYEGGSTLFGPHSLEAYQAILKSLAEQMVFESQQEKTSPSYHHSVKHLNNPPPP